MEYYAGGTSIRYMAANGESGELVNTEGHPEAERLARDIVRALTDAYEAGQDGE